MYDFNTLQHVVSRERSKDVERPQQQGISVDFSHPKQQNQQGEKSGMIPPLDFIHELRITTRGTNC